MRARGIPKPLTSSRTDSNSLLGRSTAKRVHKPLLCPQKPPRYSLAGKLTDKDVANGRLGDGKCIGGCRILACNCNGISSLCRYSECDLFCTLIGRATKSSQWHWFWRKYCSKRLDLGLSILGSCGVAGVPPFSGCDASVGRASSN